METHWGASEPSVRSGSLDYLKNWAQMKKCRPPVCAVSQERVSEAKRVREAERLEKSRCFYSVRETKRSVSLTEGAEHGGIFTVCWIEKKEKRYGERD